MNISEFDKQFRRKIILDGGDWKTAKTYGNAMCLFMKFHESNFDTPIKIPIIEIENYILHLTKEKLSASYINQFIASAKRFYAMHGQPQKCAKLVYHNNPPKCPSILTVEEIHKMTSAPIYLKQRVAINLLYDAALRRSELINLKVEHISRDRKIVIENSKFGKNRIVVITQRTLDLLRDYYKKFRPKEYLLEGEGKPQYSAKSIENVVKDTARLCGVYTKVTPHILRHSRITHLLDAGATEGYVSEFAGHSNINTTHKYYHRLTVGAMQRQFDEIDSKLLTSQIKHHETFSRHAC